MKFEFLQVATNTYYFNDTNRVLLYKTGLNSVVLFDAGKNQKAGIKILDTIKEHGWNLEAIYLTHSHADHMGGASYLKVETGCPVYCPKDEINLTVPTYFEPAFMYGGFPPNEMRLPFLCAQPCESLLLTEDKLPKGIEMFPLPGHTFNMYGFKTDDNVYFLTDAYVGSEILDNHEDIALDIIKSIKNDKVLRLFDEFKNVGVYPFYFEDESKYFDRINETISIILHTDLGRIFNIKPDKIDKLKKLLITISVSKPLELSIEKLSSTVGITKSTLYKYIEYLSNYYVNSYSIMLILILPENFMLLYIFRSLYRRYLY